MASPQAPDDHTERQRFVASLRALMDAVILSENDDAWFSAPADELDRLSADLRRTAGSYPWYWKVSEPRGSVNGLVHAWSAFNPIAPVIVFERGGSGAIMRGSFTATSALTGPPDIVHGGIVATIIDHVMGAFLADIGRASFTASLEVAYRRPTPVGTRIDLECRMTEVAGSRSTVEVALSHEGGVTAVGTGVFVLVDRGDRA